MGIFGLCYGRELDLVSHMWRLVELREQSRDSRADTDTHTVIKKQRGCFYGSRDFSESRASFGPQSLGTCDFLPRHFKTTKLPNSYKVEPSAVQSSSQVRQPSRAS